MPRTTRHNDFVAPVEGVGTFTFGRRNFGDQLKIAAEYGRVSEGQTLAPSDASFANMVAELRVLTVRAPEDWDIDTLDPDEGYKVVAKVWGVLQEKEASFRKRVPGQPEAAGAGSGKVD